MLAITDNVFVVSDEGVFYLKRKYPIFAKKIEVSRLGVFSNCVKQNIGKGWEISILSCSNI